MEKKERKRNKYTYTFHLLFMSLSSNGILLEKALATCKFPMIIRSAQKVDVLKVQVLQES
jgi:hypothetical protein